MRSFGSTSFYLSVFLWPPDVPYLTSVPLCTWASLRCWHWICLFSFWFWTFQKVPACEDEILMLSESDSLSGEQIALLQCFHSQGVTHTMALLDGIAFSNPYAHAVHSHRLLLRERKKVLCPADEHAELPEKWSRSETLKLSAGHVTEELLKGYCISSYRMPWIAIHLLSCCFFP